MVTLMFVVGSVQVDVEVVVEVEEVEVLQEMAVLAGAAPQDAIPSAPTSRRKRRRRFTAPRSLRFGMA
jgi:hypothetical protein